MNYISGSEAESIPLIPTCEQNLDAFLQNQGKAVENWVKSSEFKAKPQQFCIVPDEGGRIRMVLFGMTDSNEPQGDKNDIETAPIWLIADLAKKLPANIYQLECDWDESIKIQAEIGWGLGAYEFNFFKKDFLEGKARAKLNVTNEHQQQINAYVDAFTLVRDLVNTPANHMMPEDLSSLTQELAEQHGAVFSEVVGDALLEENYPAIHAVGRASDHPPRLLQLEWGASDKPLLSLVGKGVCFDTGGLDLKPSKFMRNMKKDMGGAAHVLGLAHLIMSMDLPVRLQVLIPAVDNAISGDAYRPGDIIDTRAHKTVEVDNTDAEGRIVLCDALALACESSPDMIIDFATLTGAARVAVGTEIPALFSNSNAFIESIQSISNSGECIWPLPLHQPYRCQLDSSVADIANCSAEGYGGAITAALYLQEFVEERTEWAHFDVMAWNTRHRAGRPKGGEAMGLLTVFEYLKERYPI